MNIGVIGRRGEGKSTLAIFLARRIQKTVQAHTIVIFDPKRTFRSIPHTNDLEVFDELLVSPKYSAIAYQPYPRTAEEVQAGVAGEFENFCDALGIEKHLGDENPSRPSLGPVVIVVDESWLLQKAQNVNPWMEKLVRLADSKKLFLIQLAHRPGDFAPRVSAQLDELFIFRQFLPNDLDVIEEMAGPEVAQMASELQPHHLIRFEVSSGTSEVWKEPRAWYSDISDESSGDNKNEQPSTSPSGAISDSDVRGPDEGSADNDGSPAESVGSTRQSS